MVAKQGADYAFPGFTAVWIHRSRYSLSVIFAPSKSWPRSRSRNFLIKFACASRMGPWIVSVVVVAFVGFAIAAASNCPNVTRELGVNLP